MFPPGSVLFPYMALPLEVFEERYLIMMANLLKTVQSRFGAVLIERDHQLGAARRCPKNDPDAANRPGPQMDPLAACD
jgi:Lon protease-like protein